MAEDKVRRGLLLKTALEILRDIGMKVPQSQVLEILQRRVRLTPLRGESGRSQDEL